RIVVGPFIPWRGEWTRRSDPGPSATCRERGAGEHVLRGGLPVDRCRAERRVSVGVGNVRSGHPVRPQLLLHTGWGASRPDGLVATAPGVGGQWLGGDV